MRSVQGLSPVERKAQGLVISGGFLGTSLECGHLQSQKDAHRGIESTSEWPSPILQICLCCKQREFGSSAKLSAIYLKADFCACAGCPAPLFQCFLGAGSSHGGKTSWEQGSGNLRLKFYSLLCDLAVWPWTRYPSSLGFGGLICKMSGWTTFSPPTLLAGLTFFDFLNFTEAQPHSQVGRNSAAPWVS